MKTKAACRCSRTALRRRWSSSRACWGRAACWSSQRSPRTRSRWRSWAGPRMARSWARPTARRARRRASRTSTGTRASSGRCWWAAPGARRAARHRVSGRRRSGRTGTASSSLTAPSTATSGASRASAARSLAAAGWPQWYVQMPYFPWIFYWKCWYNGELPLENDDFLLKNGHLFDNLRCCCRCRWSLPTSSWWSTTTAAASSAARTLPAFSAPLGYLGRTYSGEYVYITKASICSWFCV